MNCKHHKNIARKDFLVHHQITANHKEGSLEIVVPQDWYKLLVFGFC